MTWTTQPRSKLGPLAAIEAGGKADIEPREGPTLVLLHGVGLRAEAWNGQIQDLSKSFHILAPDMPGHGETPLTEPLASLGHYADLLAQALSDLDQPLLIAGHSMGAMLAVELAGRLSNCVGTMPLNGIYRRSAQAAQAVQARAAELDGKTMADPSATLKRWFGKDETPEAAACRHWLTTVNPLGYKYAYSVFAQEDGPSDAQLQSLSCPALFITGAEEPNSTPQMSKAMAAMTPQGEAHVVDGAAHMLPMTHVEVINQKIRQFAGKVLA